MCNRRYIARQSKVTAKSNDVVQSVPGSGRLSRGSNNESSLPASPPSPKKKITHCTLVGEGPQRETTTATEGEGV